MSGRPGSTVVGSTSTVTPDFRGSGTSLLHITHPGVLLLPVVGMGRGLDDGPHPSMVSVPHSVQRPAPGPGRGTDSGT